MTLYDMNLLERGRGIGIYHRKLFGFWFPLLRIHICLGTTQGGLMLPILLNVAVGSVVCHWISLTVEDGEVTQDGLGQAVGQIMGVFYADDEILGSQDLACLQGDLNFLIGLFRWIGMAANVAKLKNINLHPGEIISGMLEEVFVRKSTHTRDLPTGND